MSRFVAHGALAVALSLVALLGASPAAAFTAKLFQPEGTVEVSRDGETWRKLRGRQRYLHDGYQVRTGDDSGARIYVNATKATIELGANALVEVGDGDVEVVSGAVEEEEDSFFGTLFASLENKFARSQRYTTVRRNVVNMNATPEAELPYRQTLSPSFPDLVWENAGAQYRYRLTVDGAARDVASAGDADMVRVSLDDLAPGDHEVVLAILEGDAEIATSKTRTLTWLSADEDAALRAEVASMIDTPVGDGISIAEVYKDRRAYVAAMDSYHSYFQDNPDDIEMRSMLAEAYSKLKLTRLNQKEAKMLQDWEMSEEG